jgi:hypothetical protein
VRVSWAGERDPRRHDPHPIVPKERMPVKPSGGPRRIAGATLP